VDEMATLCRTVLRNLRYVEITYDAAFLIGGATAHDWSLGPIRKLAEELKGVELKVVDASSK
jgi:hypothetical protein